MGNERSKMSTPAQLKLLDQLCGLTLQDYHQPYCLSSTPTPTYVFHDMPCDMASSSMVDEAEDTQALGTPLEPIDSLQGLCGSALKSQSQQINQQKNQFCKKPTMKNKKISKAQKPKKKQSITTVNPQQPQNQIDEGMRDQNNCKSYHKLVKNFLIKEGLGGLIEQYQTKYHTRYYFIACLIIIKYHTQEPFLPIYQNIVRAQLQAQEKKIIRKTKELQAIKEKMQVLRLKDQSPAALKIKESSLLSQIEHIKVVKFQIENYSVRSCRAFFQGEIEESLKILYLKNDPVMRKKYYFEQALEIVKNIQTQMRKNQSHR